MQQRRVNRKRAASQQELVPQATERVCSFSCVWPVNTSEPGEGLRDLASHHQQHPFSVTTWVEMGLLAAVAGGGEGGTRASRGSLVGD